MSVKIHLDLSSETCTFTTIPSPIYVLTKRLLSLHVDWDENVLVFTKQLQIMNKVVRYNYAKKIMNGIVIYVKQ